MLVISMGKWKRKTNNHAPSRMKTEWNTVKDFKMGTPSANGFFISGKALNGKLLIKHITTVTLRAMLCDEYIY